MDLRSQRSAKMLLEDEKISFDELMQYKHSTQVELADRLLDDLIPVARQGSEKARRAAEVLATWDRKVDADSRGAVLFAFWKQAMDADRLFAKPWSEDAPLTTPDGLANPAEAVRVLEATATKVEVTYGALDVAWGEVFRLPGEANLPANGGDGALGVFRSVWFAPGKDNRFQAVAGDSFVAAIEFSNPVKAMALNSYGNASQPGSPHADDQSPLFARKELRPVWRSRSEIEAHLSSRQKF
jgi:acyl-homoserine-lactone acylase